MDDSKEYKLWHIAPPPEIVGDMLEQAHAIWSTYDDTYGYATEKKEMLKVVQRDPREFMVCWTMFDWKNQQILYSKLHPETQDYLDKVLNGE